MQILALSIMLAIGSFVVISGFTVFNLPEKDPNDRFAGTLMILGGSFVLGSVIALGVSF